MKKGIVTVLLGLYGFIVSLVFYILSYSYSSDEWGQYIDLNRNYAVLALGCLFVMALGAYFIYEDVTKNRVVGFSGVLISLIGLIEALYCLGLGIKDSIKGQDGTVYYILFPLGLFLLAYGVLS